MSLSIQRELLTTDDGKVKFWQQNPRSREHYNVAIWVEGTPEEIDGIESVTYFLHESFRDREKTSKDKSKKFRLVLWTWGAFEILVKIKSNTGEVKRIKYYLTWDLPADDGENYYRVE